MADTYALEIDIEPKFPSAAIQQMVDVAGDAFGKALASPKVKSSMEALSSSFAKAFGAGQGVMSGLGHKIGAGIGNVASNLPGAGGIAKGAGAIAGLVSGIGSAIMGVLGPIGAIITIVMGIVQAANPAVVEQLMLAFNEIWGVIGQALTPVIAALIPFIQAWGDVVASLLPVLKPIIWLWTTLAKIMTEVIKAFGYLISLITGGGTSRGSTSHGVGMTGIGELGKQILVGGMATAGVDWKKAIVETAEYSRRTSENTARREESKPSFTGNG